MSVLDDPFTITEVKLWGKVSEFSFQGFSDLAKHLKMLLALKKINKQKKYNIIIQEI